MVKKISSYTLALLLFSTQIFSQDTGEKSNSSFFMRFLLGGGSSTMKIEEGTNEMELSGFSGVFRFQIGAAVSQNLYAFGEIGGVTIQNPEIKIGGMTIETDDMKASNFDFGGGLTYYFMPATVYITGSVLASRAKFEATSGSTTVKGESDLGLGLFFGLGKEWAASETWSLGATAFLSYSSVPDKGNSDATISNMTFGVAFSATMH